MPSFLLCVGAVFVEIPELMRTSWRLHGTCYFLKKICLIINHITGWGIKRNDETNYPCNTDSSGPAVYASCRFPFYHLKRIKGNKLYGKDKKCVTGPTPSSYDKRCKEFEQSKGKSSMPKRGKSLMIKYNNGKRSTVCYYKGGGVH